MPSGPQLESSMKELCHRLTSDLHQCADLDLQERTLNLLAWVTKAMVVRGHRLSAELTSQLTSLLSEPKLGGKAAESFQVIMTPFPDVLCASVGAIVTPTFQQRFLVQNLPSLLSGFRGTQNEVKENYLLAVAGMLTHVPQQVLVSELPQLMPVLASSLRGSNPRLHMEALKALTAGLKHSPQLLTSYLSDILPDCLSLATDAATMSVRIVAVQCVGEMVHLPAAALQPHKAAVVKSLKTAIDDPKRLVRKEAVTARTAWYLL
ncbi:MMS19 nucleotide excision repair protein homolog [Babylonia areolata]|uniref:MMS19 nucleotide excision repair protein homolog n=1 Tax=Babylonia areolata TaxID=304850 RepID=UPI003FD67D71